MCLLFDQPKRAHAPPLLIDLQFTNAYQQKDFCTSLPPATAFLQIRSFGIPIPAKKANTVLTVLISGSQMVKKITKFGQSKRVPVYFQVPLEELSLQGAHPLLKLLTP